MIDSLLAVVALDDEGHLTSNSALSVEDDGDYPIPARTSTGGTYREHRLLAAIERSGYQLAGEWRDVVEETGGLWTVRLVLAGQ